MPVVAPTPAVPQVAGVTIRQVKGSRLLSAALSVSANCVGLSFTDFVTVLLAPSAIGGGAEYTYVTVLLVLVTATFASPAASDGRSAGIVAFTVPDAVMPLTATLYFAGPPVTLAVVGFAVPLRAT